MLLGDAGLETKVETEELCPALRAPSWSSTSCAQVSIRLRSHQAGHAVPTLPGSLYRRDFACCPANACVPDWCRRAISTWGIDALLRSGLVLHRSA